MSEMTKMCQNRLAFLQGGEGSHSICWFLRELVDFRKYLGIQKQLFKNELLAVQYRLGTVNSKSFVGKVFLRIKWKFELYYTL